MHLPELKSGGAGNLNTTAPVGELITDGNPKGFGVLVGKTGRTFVVRFRVKGKPEQYTRRIGPIDGQAAIGLAAARAEAHRVKLMAAGNRALRIAPRHPDQDLWDREAAAKTEAAAIAVEVAAAAKVASETFKAVADQYLDDVGKGGGARLASSGELRRKLKVDLANWHDRPISNITEQDIDDLVRAKGNRAPVAANRLLAFIKVVFGYAKKRHKIERSPAIDVEKPHEEESRERILGDAEIKVLWQACGQLQEPIGRLYKLLLVTGQRRGEVAGLRRSELGTLTLKTRDLLTGRETSVDHRAWRLPKGRTKNGKPHTLPLSDLALELIDGAPELKGYDDKPLDHLLASGFAGDNPVSGWSKYRRLLDGEIAAVLAKEAGEEVNLGRHRFALPFHTHDLRATVASQMEEALGIPEHVIARVLNHSPGPTGSRTMTRRYIRNTYDREAADALQAWAERLKQIVGLNVKPLGKRRRA